MRIILLIHSLVLLGATIGGALGYVTRGQWKDAIGISLTLGVSALVEMIAALNWIF